EHTFSDGKQAPKTQQTTETPPANSTKVTEVIECPDSGLFSSYSICAPGVCCSKIPIVIRRQHLPPDIGRYRADDPRYSLIAQGFSAYE
ncbi:hypothetical protein PENTCL1PPCAC_23961, partial [Pristionchus entomophagus]